LLFISFLVVPPRNHITVPGTYVADRRGPAPWKLAGG
jgi:hypothetical protein